MVQKNIGDPQAFYPTSECNMMLLPRRNDNTECCFICGANQAIWLLNSNPTADNKPFFPFLQYQKPPLNANKLDSNGRCLACNVCYLFLLQQWKSYQDNNTPILKRLYWLKRPAEEYQNISGKLQNGMMPISRELDNLPGSQRFIPSSNSRPIENALSDVDRKQSYHGEKEIKLLDRVNLNNNNECSLACALCSVKEKRNLMKYILTARQSSSDMPFYSKVIFGKKGIIEIGNPEGRILVCSQCHSTLYRQWLEFEKVSVPWHDREYYIDPNGNPSNSETVACFLCQEIHPRDALFQLYCKQIADEPFYPFLKNLTKTFNTLPVCDEGFTFSCGKCKLFLEKQWDIFEESNVPQEERVYRTHPSQPPLLPSDIESDKSIACFICSAKNDIKFSKRIYCNSGSNMNLSFLKSFPRNKDGFFCEETGETFVCISCFKELKQHWIKYRSTLFESGQIKYDDETFETMKSCKVEKVDCEICHFDVSASDILKLNILPPASDEKEDNEQPFFPFLKQLKFSDDILISACRLCALNLLNQWSSYEACHDDNIPNKYDRQYRINEFVCYICNASILRQAVGWEDVDNIKEGVDIVGSLLAVKYGKDIGICNECKQNYIYVKEKQERELKDNTKTTEEEQSLKEEKSEAQLEPGMKATATVPPFMNLSMRNHTQEHSNPPSSSSNSSEGSFAAALRKLAQQAPGFPIPVVPRDRRPGSPLPKNGSDLMPSGIIPHPSPHPPQGSRITGTPSIMAPVNPHSSSLSNVEKQEMLMKATYSHMHSRDHSHQLKDVLGRHPNRPQIAPGTFPYPDRDEHHHRRSQEQFDSHSREAFDPNRRSSITSSTSVSLSSHSLKERPSSSIGLVHPQPVRKLHDEESVKSSSMNSMHYPSRDTTAAMRPLSPELSRYGPFVTPRQHQHPHGTPSSCPVHGHEGGHQHDERSNRPPGMPFDPPNHVPREFHNHHAQHPRIREEMQFLHGRHPLERKEHLPSHHALEEDLRRRGLDYRWAGLPPHLLDEQYRRHILNGGHEHAAFKSKTKPSSHIEAPHGQVYLPHFYYGRDYPIPVEPYLAHGMPPKNDPLQRHGPPISPRLLDYYRRSEHADRTRNEFEAERRAEERREKERASVMRTSSVDSIKHQKKNEGCSTPEKDRGSISPGEKKKDVSSEESRSNVNTPTAPKMPFFKGLELNSKPPKTSDTSHQPNSINSLLSSSKLPDPKTELAAASILANMNRINQSPCSDEVESLTSSSGMENHLHVEKPIKLEEDSQQTATVEGEQIPEEKLLYMMTLGLVPHNRKRALEDEFERKRWDRKFRKFRGRPKKRSKRENTTEESSVNGDTRPNSELDFYSGPMTRHKQQLLQEQECLLEQIQKRHNSDTNDDSTEDMKLLTSLENSQNDDEPSSPSKENMNDNELNDKTSSNYSASIVKSLSQGNSIAGDSPGTVNSLLPSRLIAILQDDQQKIGSKPSTSVENLSQVQHQELIDGIKVLDNSRFGQPVTETNLDKKFLSWPGVERISQAFTAYNSEYDLMHQQLMKRYEELERESVNLQKKREYIQKNLVVYHNRSMDISDQRRDLHQTVENIHNNLRTILNL